MKFKNLFITLSLFVSVAAFASPSFDCDKVSTPAELLICGSPFLSDLDRDLNIAYKIHLSKSTTPDIDKRIQIEWIREVRNKCLTEACIQYVTVVRIEQLDPQTIMVKPRATQTSTSDIYYLLDQKTYDPVADLLIGICLMVICIVIIGIRS